MPTNEKKYGHLFLENMVVSRNCSRQMNTLVIFVKINGDCRFFD